MISEGISAGDFMLYSSAVFTFGGALGGVTSSIVSLFKTSNLMTTLIDVLNLRRGLEKRRPFDEELKTIEFRNVYFSYNGSDKYVLEDISFTVNSNEKFSVIGENGAGKSTLVKLLLGMYSPTKGAIYINGEAMDTERFDYTPLFSAVFQDYKIFSFTVEDNIRMSDKAGRKGKDSRPARRYGAAEREYRLIRNADILRRRDKLFGRRAAKARHNPRALQGCADNGP